jgi:hypothetical protein
MKDRIEDVTAVTRSANIPDLDLAPFTSRGVLGIADRAELSLTAQARLLKDRGASVEEIASQLGLTIAIVEGDLGVHPDASSGELLV